MPFLLDLLHLPADMMQLYFASGIFVGQFGTLAAAMHLFALAVLGGFAMAGALRFQWKRLVPLTALTLGLVAGAVVGLRAYFSLAVENAYDKDKIIAEMRPLFATGSCQGLQISAASFAGAIGAVPDQKDPRPRRYPGRISR